jgi:hypothetical protein
VHSRRTSVWYIYTTLRLPGELLVPSKTSIQSPVADSTYASRLNEAMWSLSAVPPRHPPFCTLATPSPTARMYSSGLMGFGNHFNHIRWSILCSSPKLTAMVTQLSFSLDRLKAVHMELPPTLTTDTFLLRHPQTLRHRESHALAVTCIGCNASCTIPSSLGEGVV